MRLPLSREQIPFPMIDVQGKSLMVSSRVMVIPQESQKRADCGVVRGLATPTWSLRGGR